MKNLIIALIFTPLLSASQEFDHIKITDDKKDIYFEKVYEVPDKAGPEIISKLYGKVAEIPGLNNVIKTDESVTADYANATLKFDRKNKKKSYPDGYEKFSAKVVIEAKNQKYRVRVTSMSAFYGKRKASLGDVYLFFGSFNTSGKKHIPALDEYFTDLFSLKPQTDW